MVVEVLVLFAVGGLWLWLWPVRAGAVWTQQPRGRPSYPGVGTESIELCPVGLAGPWTACKEVTEL